MRSVSRVLQKVFVLEFYRSNASFFLLTLGLAGGFMRSYDHIALAEFFVSSQILLLIPILVWTLYTIKVIRFNMEVLSRNENEFLYSLSLLPKPKQWTSSAQILSSQLAPVFFYATFLILIAVKNSFFITVFVASIACLVLTILSSAHLIYVLLHPHVQKTTWRLTRFINTRVTKPYFLFFPEWIVRREPFMVAGTKSFSVLVLLGIIKLYDTGEYEDLRLFGMGVVLAFAANVNIVWELHRFDNLHFSLLRNLPLTFIQRLGHFALAMILLTLPEAGMILNNLPRGFSYVSLLSVMFFAWSIPLLLYGSLYRRDYAQERLTTIVFFTAMGLIVLILFKVPLSLLGALNACAGTMIWIRYYYHFEFQAREEPNRND